MRRLWALSYTTPEPTGGIRDVLVRRKGPGTPRSTFPTENTQTWRRAGRLGPPSGRYLLYLSFGHPADTGKASLLEDLLQPGGAFSHRGGIQGIDDLICPSLGINKPRALQNIQMPGNRGLGNIEMPGNLPGAEAPLPEQPENFSSVWTYQGLKKIVAFHFVTVSLSRSPESYGARLQSVIPSQENSTTKSS